ncbi:MAG: carbon monoxide dehydrogenase subunit G [Burkholderiaceae bacterium]|nr:carbon monoxide dehydrogenase subunit G [Burkholderiaceae bacterium]
MDMQGSKELGVSQQIAWDALNNPDVLKACIPGCTKVEATGDNAFEMAVSLKIGPVSAKFTGSIVLTDVDAPNSYTLQFEGQGGPAGFGKGSSHVQLTPNGNGCLLNYTVNASVGGKVAQLGQRLIDGVAGKMADDFFKRFEAYLAEHHGVAADAAPSGAADASSGGAAHSAAAPHGDEYESRGASKRINWMVAVAVLGLVAYYALRQV